MSADRINSASKKPETTGVAGFRESIARMVTSPFVWFLAKTRLTPDAVTWFGFILAVVAAALVYQGNLVGGGIMVLVAGLFDILDGSLARRTNRVTKFGGALDSTLDRFSEAFQLLAIIMFFARSGDLIGVFLAGAALPFSLLVSYVRARAEGLGLSGKTGIFTRTERVIILAVALILGNWLIILKLALALIIVFSLITVCQRLYHIWKETR